MENEGEERQESLGAHLRCLTGRQKLHEQRTEPRVGEHHRTFPRAEVHDFQIRKGPWGPLSVVVGWIAPKTHGQVPAGTGTERPSQSFPRETGLRTEAALGITGTPETRETTAASLRNSQGKLLPAWIPHPNHHRGHFLATQGLKTFTSQTSSLKEMCKPGTLPKSGMCQERGRRGIQKMSLMREGQRQVPG